MDDVLATLAERRRRFTIEEYYRMGEVGIFGPEERVELIEGEIISMSPIGHRHAFCVAELTTRLVRGVGDRAFLWPQNPVHLFLDTVPQPDVVLLEPPSSRYARNHPDPADVLLVIEVAETSYRYDRDVKLRLYARAGIKEAWIVDLVHSVVEVFWEPGRAGYARTRRVERGGALAPIAVPDTILAVNEILPPPDAA